MLTADLLIFKIAKNEVEPAYVHVDAEPALTEAAGLIALFEVSLGKTRDELETALGDRLESSPQPLFLRGLFKLLEDRSQFSSEAEVDLLDLRKQVFEGSARAWEAGTWSRERVLADASQSLGMAADVLERRLYADLPEEAVLEGFETLSPKRLLERYNTALAQAVLFKAVKLEIELDSQSPAAIRGLFRALKFHRLLHSALPREKGGYRLSIDGPLSLFGPQPRYGLRMAAFLPHVIRLRGWRLSAELLWGVKRLPRRFSLDAHRGLVAHVSGSDHVPDEFAAFAERFAKLAKGQWSLEPDPPILSLPNAVLVPDFRFRHESSGVAVDLEILPCWRQESLDRRLATLKAAGLQHYMLGVSRQGCLDKTEHLPESVYVFRSIPNATEILKRLQGLVAPPLLPFDGPLRA